MQISKMHADEILADAGLVRMLLEEQFPQWAKLPLDPVTAYGTDHHIYRLGDELAVRLPRIRWAAQQAALEAAWLPKLAPHLPLAVPVTRALGRPASGYPFPWSVVEWLPGESASIASGDLQQMAIDLAGFIKALQHIDTAGAHPRRAGARGAPLAAFHASVKSAVLQLGDRIDGVAALGSWEASLNAPAWDGPEVWVHGDLLPGNLLMTGGRLLAVIDFGGLNVGDPACDLQPAWHSFTGSSRQRFRSELDVDEATWLRGRGWVLLQSVIALPYYWDTNPGIVRQSLLALERVLSDSAS